MNLRTENLALAAGEVEDAIKGKPGLVLDEDLKAAISKLSEALTNFRRGRTEQEQKYFDRAKTVWRGRTEQEQKYFDRAKTVWQKEGEVEIDDNAVVSVSDDDGAYVEAWVWVSDSTPAISHWS